MPVTMAWWTLGRYPVLPCYAWSHKQPQIVHLVTEKKQIG